MTTPLSLYTRVLSSHLGRDKSVEAADLILRRAMDNKAQRVILM